jgi:hypothetical protein
MEKDPLLDAGGNGVTTTDDLVDEVKTTTSVSVRETSRLYRLRSARFVAVIAADTEAEARELAARQDVFGGNWRDQAFAVAEFEDTGRGSRGRRRHVQRWRSGARRAGEGAVASLILIDASSSLRCDARVPMCRAEAKDRPTETATRRIKHGLEKGGTAAVLVICRNKASDTADFRNMRTGEGLGRRSGVTPSTERGAHDHDLSRNSFHG